ncbi:hypothetical protein [Jannaschia formosa]|uniref:hypothetical protein n=1 Tax=Jannaschia formosa TaxID=2259592 RepID=UPI000E1C3811|nr:hypothetical protein [Jannaschia formosa]TFL16790.1 hypothetical protein DR046_18040 [Jannaschia formosa]
MLRLTAYAAVLGAVVVVTVLAVRDLMPPTTLRFAAGIEGGGYWRFAERYRTILARDGIALELVPTAGSVENAALLDAREVQAGFLQGGVGPVEDAVALGAIFIEPLLIFSRLQPETDRRIPRNVALWRGLDIAAGAEGSGTRAAARALLAAGEVPTAANTLLPLGGETAARALLDGTADVAIFVAPLSAPYLVRLLSDDGIGLVDVSHATALSRRMPQAMLVDVPSGTFQLSPPLPPQDRELLALVARIVAVPDLHPALVDRLVEAAIEIHRPGDVLSAEGMFPSLENTSLPAHSYARDRLSDGPSPLADLVPYWMVAQIERLAILLLPIVFLLLPLLRALPGLYAWGIRSRVFRHYARIREIDAEVAECSDPARLAALDAELVGLDRQIAGLKLPLAYRDAAYDARLHVELLRRRIEGAGAA